MTTDTEIQRYIAKCREMSNDGEHLWWSRLADILQELSDENDQLNDEAFNRACEDSFRD